MTEPDPLNLVYPQPDLMVSPVVYGWPYPSGYAQVSDVEANINAGTWDPDDPTSSPTGAQVTQRLISASAQIDAALTARGYFVPLQPSPGYTPAAGTPTYGGVGVQAWYILRDAAAAYGTHYVESSRHGGVGNANDDTTSTTWLTEFNSFLNDLRAAKDNLTAFGVAGNFPPEIDPSKALSSGSMGWVCGKPHGPFFTRYQELGSGWENNSGENVTSVSGAHEPPPLFGDED